MAPMAVALILVPPPSLSLHPSQGVSLGDNVTLHCHLPSMAEWVWLYQEGGWPYRKRKDKEQDPMDFSLIGTKREHAGTYRCQYEVPWSKEASEKSDPVELVLTDRRYPPPGISLHPEQCVEMGTNITIRCWNKYFGATFLLHKDGTSDPIQPQDRDGVGTASFTLFGVTPADSGTYRCSYRPRGYPFISSPLGDSVMLEVTPTTPSPGTPKHPDPTGAEEQSRANMVMAVVRGIVAALVFGLGVFFVIDARSLWIRRDDSCGEQV
ncbi:hypothetical protein CIB84_016095 [Bambusicola thoracicus]|uniref:Ig-like domain-containing protein n=1 Tax=Bambusicola thoracicus TaxID=9083 RepID=A0A2P4S7T7_BAMTH|nr:hypothetical protein CIB84_016095 [Bambusicola thoracicus]